MAEAASALLGVIQAGGQSTRYGSPKALAHVYGEPIIARVMRVLAPVVDEVVLIANDARIADSTRLPARADVRAGLGALGGIYTALLWAKERAAPGILTVACDMPFLSTDLLRAIVIDATNSQSDVVVPESGGRRGIEPLCAFYATSCLPAIEAAIARDDLRMIGFHDAVTVTRIPLEDVRVYGDPDTLFMNVNTLQERERAEAIAQERQGA
jgi:molybdopterin-guanine dinucleotide biosynthesis protein A